MGLRSEIGNLRTEAGPYQSARTRRARSPRCFICEQPVLYEVTTVGVFVFRKKTHQICRTCRGRYWKPVEQAQAFGGRFPFLEKSEVTALTRRFGLFQSNVIQYSTFTRICSLLLLLKKRQIKRQKEVMWMPDDMTRKLLKLPDRVAMAMRDTFVIRGDDATVSDDIALLKIKDLLEEIDPDIFRRKSRKRKRLS